MTTVQHNESTTLELLSSVEVQGHVVAPAELAGFFDASVVNDNLVRLYVRAFGWEVNRNNFLFNKKALLAEHVDALGATIPAWKSFERQLVNANHAMRDNNNSQIDRVIGFIEDAELKDDGVYLTLVVWKRTMSDDEITQIRDAKVSVSMEVRYTNPQVIVDGQMYPPSAVSYDPSTTVRTMADDSVLSFIGIAILFDNIAPGYGSAEVILQENAQEDGQALVSRDTQMEVSMEKMEKIELERQLAELQTKQAELAATLESKVQELASANAALEAKRQELEKLYAELDALRVARFNEAVASHFDLGKLSADTAAWLLDMIRWSGDVDTTAARLAEVAGAVLPGAKGKTAAAETQDCADGSCGEGAARKAKAEQAQDTSGAESAAAATNETAPLGNLAGAGSGEAPRFGHRHL